MARHRRAAVVGALVTALAATAVAGPATANSRPYGPDDAVKETR